MAEHPDPVPTNQPTVDLLAAIRDRVALQALETGGVFRRQHLSDWGTDPGIIRAMVRRGWWTKLHHGVYADTRSLQPATDPRTRHALHCAAALAALPGPAYAFGVSAAVLHGLPADRGLLGPPQIVRPAGLDQRSLARRVRTPSQLGGVGVHTHLLAPEDLTTVGGIPTITRDVAALTTAAVSDAEWGIVTLDAAAWKRPEALGSLDLLTQGWSQLRGIGAVRRALPLVRTGAQTPLETLSRIRLMRHGLPEPALQHPFNDDEGLIGYVDMAWLDWNVVGEADGRLKYETRADLINEKTREDRLRALGLIVVRWTWADIMSRPGTVAERIRKARSVALRHSA